MIGLLFAASTAVATPVQVTPIPQPPRPPVVMSAPRGVFGRPGVTQTIAVQVRQDARIVWSGELTRSSTGSASFNQDVRESRSCGVADRGRYGGGSISNGLTVSIGPDFRNPSEAGADDRVEVMVSRTRPYGGDPCAGSLNSSTVRFGATSTLARGRPVTLAGEGGLSIVLTLR